jgi:hypothetical protein
MYMGLKRDDDVTDLGGCLLNSKGTMHFYSHLRDISLHTERSSPEPTKQSQDATTEKQ